MAALACGGGHLIILLLLLIIIPLPLLSRTTLIIPLRLHGCIGGGWRRDGSSCELGGGGGGDRGWVCWQLLLVLAGVDGHRHGDVVGTL